MNNKFLKFADDISRISGTAISWLIIVLVFELVYDTIARYVFNAPTIWSFDISYMLYAILFMIGGVYTLMDNKHIRVDVFTEKFSPKNRALLEIIGYLLFFFPVVLVLLIYGIIFVHESWIMGECQTKSYWSPRLCYFKLVIPISALLLVLQGVAQFIRQINALRSKGDDAHGT